MATWATELYKKQFLKYSQITIGNETFETGLGDINSQVNRKKKQYFLIVYKLYFLNIVPSTYINNNVINATFVRQHPLYDYMVILVFPL